MKKARVLHSN